ncbi:hypothetical protein [Meridianimarinicoccus aquatilis]|nr:hypothetical protein [Fluviibacterium aquatile]QIE43986.1 hypothetical protein G5B39_18470 [Rhodobacteraceae bacterium SC52]
MAKLTDFYGFAKTANAAPQRDCLSAGYLPLYLPQRSVYVVHNGQGQP